MLYLNSLYHVKPLINHLLIINSIRICTKTINNCPKFLKIKFAVLIMLRIDYENFYGLNYTELYFHTPLINKLIQLEKALSSTDVK